MPLKPQLISKQVQSNCALFFHGGSGSVWLTPKKGFSMSHHPVAQAPVHTFSRGGLRVHGVLESSRRGQGGSREEDG